MEIGEAATNTIGNHIVVFPFMAKGHTIPLLHFSAALVRRRVRVTLLTTPANATFISRFLDLPQPNIDVSCFPFPGHPSLPPGCESTDTLPLGRDAYKAFVHATRLLDRPFRDALQILHDKSDLPLAVVSDMFLWWTRPICSEFGVPRLAFNGMGVFTSVVTIALIVHQPHRVAATGAGHGGDELEFHVPGVPVAEGLLRLKLAEVPGAIMRPEEDPFAEFQGEMIHEQRNSWGMLINSYVAMEPEYAGLLKDHLDIIGMRGWLVGPLSLLDRRPKIEPTDESENLCLRWLEEKPARSVLYVSFGTQADLSGEQLDEIAHGLDKSGHSFLWVVRSKAWVPPEGMLERLERDRKSRGLIHFAWAPQKQVLSHPATGGFLSHCGWNSVLEAVSAGVPILTWPQSEDQLLNAKFVVDVARVGVRLAAGRPGEVVGRTAVSDGVRELMGGRNGMETMKRAADLGKEAKAAVEEDGSSSSTLHQLLLKLRAAR